MKSLSICASQACLRSYLKHLAFTSPPYLLSQLRHQGWGWGDIEVVGGSQPCWAGRGQGGVGGGGGPSHSSHQPGHRKQWQPMWPNGVGWWFPSFPPGGLLILRLCQHFYVDLCPLFNPGVFRLFLLCLGIPNKLVYSTLLPFPQDASSG